MEDFVDYKEKYLKYKLKYLKLQSELKSAGITPSEKLNFGQTMGYRQTGGELTQDEYKQKYYKYKAKYYQLVEFVDQNGGMKYLSAAWDKTKKAASSAASSIVSGAKTAYTEASKLTGQNAKNIDRVRDILENNSEFTIQKNSNEKDVKELLDKKKKENNEKNKLIDELAGKLYSCKNKPSDTVYNVEKCFKA